VLKVVHDASVPNDNTESGSSLLDEIVRDGARRMLAAALQAEVAAYIEAHADQLDSDGHRLVVRNGSHQPREVMTAAGAVAVRAPRVNDKRVDAETGERKRFSSAILPAWSRKSPRVAEAACTAGEARVATRQMRPQIRPPRHFYPADILPQWHRKRSPATASGAGGSDQSER
jgi:Transposase, Mutator family